MKDVIPSQEASSMEARVIEELFSLGCSLIKVGVLPTPEAFGSDLRHDALDSILASVPSGIDTTFFKEGKNWRPWVSTIAGQHLDELLHRFHTSGVTKAPDDLAPTTEESTEALDSLKHLGFILIQAGLYPTTDAFITAIIGTGISDMISSVADDIDISFFPTDSKWHCWFRFHAREYPDLLAEGIRMFPHEQSAKSHLIELGTVAIESSLFKSPEDFIASVVDSGIPSVPSVPPIGKDQVAFLGDDRQEFIRLIAAIHRKNLIGSIRAKVG